MSSQNSRFKKNKVSVHICESWGFRQKFPSVSADIKDEIVQQGIDAMARRLAWVPFVSNHTLDGTAIRCFWSKKIIGHRMVGVPPPVKPDYYATFCLREEVPEDGLESARI